MKIILRFFAVFFICIFVMSCFKNRECRKSGVSELCFKNNSSDTLGLCMGCNSVEFIIPPGQTVCKEVGYKTVSYYNVDLNEDGSTDDSYAIDVDECHYDIDLP